MRSLRAKEVRPPGGCRSIRGRSSTQQPELPVVGTITCRPTRMVGSSFEFLRSNVGRAENGANSRTASQSDATESAAARRRVPPVASPAGRARAAELRSDWQQRRAFAGGGDAQPLNSAPWPGTTRPPAARYAGTDPRPLRREAPDSLARRVSALPMMDWTDARFFCRSKNLSVSLQACLLYVPQDPSDLNALIRSAIYARRPDDFTSFVYSFRRSHWKRRGIVSSGWFENRRDRPGAR